MLVFLHEQKQPVAYPLKRKDSCCTTEVTAPEGKRDRCFPVAPGRAVNEKLNGRQSQYLGKALANIHKTLDRFKSSFSISALSSEYLLDRSMEAIASLYKYRSSDIDYLKHQIEKIKIQLELQLPNLAPNYGICVGDVHLGNTHFTQQDEPTLFDFDQCGYGWRAFDIAKFIHTALIWNIEATIKNAFLQGYQGIRQLDTAELASIPIFVKVAHTWVMGISTSMVGDVLPYGWFTDDWLNTRLAILRSLDNYNNGN